MPKTTPTKQQTNNSSSSGRPISSRTRKAARNLLTINNSSTTTSTSSSSSTPSSNSSSNTTVHFVPLKKSKKEVFDKKLYSRRLHYISCGAWITVDTFLEPLHQNKTSLTPVKVGDKYHIMNPLSDFNEVQVERISPDGTMCGISRINLNKIHEFKNRKSIEFLQMQFEFNKGKGKVPAWALRNQHYCRKKTTVTKFHTVSGYVSSPIGLKKMS